MEIINETFPDTGKIGIYETKITYIQDSDSTEEDFDQLLTIETRDAGGGKFLHLKTEGWSFDSIEDLVDVLNDFNKRIQ